MKTSFLLARHGQTQWNKLKKLQGQLDSPLTDEGIQQANDLAHSLSTYKIAHIVSSPLPRASGTAEIVLGKLQHQHTALTRSVDIGFIERHFGDWQGILFSDASDKPYFSEIFYQVTAHAPPQGESGLAAAERFSQALQNLAASQAYTGDILVITHGDVLRCFLSQLNDLGFSDAFELYANCCVIEVIFDHHIQQFSMAPRAA